MNRKGGTCKPEVSPVAAQTASSPVLVGVSAQCWNVVLTLDHFAADSLAQAHYFSSECQALALSYKRMGFFVF